MTGIDNDLVCVLPHIHTHIMEQYTLSPVCSNRLSAFVAFIAKHILLAIDQNLRGPACWFVAGIQAKDFTIGKCITTQTTYVVGFPTKLTVPIPPMAFQQHFVTSTSMPMCGSCALAPFPRSSPCLLDNIIGKFSDFAPPIIVGTMIIALYQQISIPHCLIAYGASISSSTVAQSDVLCSLGISETASI